MMDLRDELEQLAGPAVAPTEAELNADLARGRSALRHRRTGQAVGGSFVRLLDSSGEFTAEVVASATGDFRFFAAPGCWTLRALSAAGNGDAVVEPTGAGIHEVDIKIA